MKNKCFISDNSSYHRIEKDGKEKQLNHYIILNNKQKTKDCGYLLYRNYCKVLS